MAAGTTSDSKATGGHVKITGGEGTSNDGGSGGNLSFAGGASFAQASSSGKPSENALVVVLISMEDIRKVRLIALPIFLLCF